MPDADEAQVNLGSVDRLVERIASSRGLDLALYRRPYLERRLAARMRVVGVQSYRRYWDLLDSDPGEYAKLLDALTINVTEFFRDQVVWDTIRRTVIPDLLARKENARGHTVRAWSAGCATGEEPYSLAMALLESMKSTSSELNVSVLATDIDTSALRQAKDAVFRLPKLEQLPPEYRSLYTEESGDGSFRVTQEVQDVVRFRKMSLFVDTPVRAIDILLCRNVFIYIDRQHQERVLENFGRALSPGGYLVLGRSEKLPSAAAEMLETVDGRERIYRKRERNGLRPAGG